MPAELTTEAKDRALKALFGAEGLLVGLTLENGQEVSDPGYTRQAIAYGRPRTLDGTVGRVMVNTGRSVFGPWARASASLIAGYIIADRDGTVLASGSLVEPQLPKAGDEVFFPAGSLPVGLRDG